MPIVVVKGSGGCADLLAYAIEESQERSADSPFMFYKRPVQEFNAYRKGLYYVIVFSK